MQMILFLTATKWLTKIDCTWVALENLVCISVNSLKRTPQDKFRAVFLWSQIWSPQFTAERPVNPWILSESVIHKTTLWFRNGGQSKTCSAPKHVERLNHMNWKKVHWGRQPTLEKYHIPAAWKLLGRTKDCWISQTHSSGHWPAGPVLPRIPQCATRKGWSDSPGRGQRSLQCRQKQCTSISRKPKDPERKKLLVWTSEVFLSW